MPLFSFRFPLRFLRGSYSRLVLSVFALACGVALVCAIDLVNRAVLRAFTEVVDTMAGRAAFQVTAGGSGTFPEQVAETVAKVSGVELAVPVVSSTAFTTDESGDLLTVHGVDLANEAAVRTYEGSTRAGDDVGDPLEFLNQADSILVTRDFATRKGLKRDDTIQLETPLGKRLFTIRGLLEPQGVARVYGGNLIVMDIYAAEAVFTKPRFVNRVDVVVTRSANLASVGEAIRGVLPAGLVLETPAQRKADLNAVMNSLQTMLQGLGIVALIAAFLIAFNRLSVVFDMRTWQLGVLRGLGVRPRSVERELLKESLFLGIAGAALGVPMGIGLGHAILPVITATTALNYKLIAQDAELAVHPSSLVVATVLGLVASLLAAMIPSWRVSRMALIEAIQSRGTERSVAPPSWMWIVRGVTLVGIAVSILMQTLTGAAEWGLAATALLAIGAALAAPLLQNALRSGLSSGMLYFFGPSTAYARAIVAQYPRRSSLTIAMLGVGLGAVIWLATVASSFERSLLETMPTVLRGDLVISSSRIASGAIEAPMDEIVLKDVARLPGVEAVVGERAIDWRYRGGPISLSGYDPNYFAGAEFGDWLLLGEPLPNWRGQLMSGEGALVSSNFQRNLGGEVGDIIQLESPNGPINLRIAGVTEDFLSPRGTVEVSRDVLRSHWGDNLVTHVLVRSSPNADAKRIAAAAQEALKGRFSIKVLTISALVSHLGDQVQKAFLPVQILGGVVLLVVLIGMADTLAANVHDRIREFGTARAVGLQGKYLNRLVVIEALIIGTLGLILAAIMGLLLGALWVQSTFVYLLGWVLTLHIPGVMCGAVVVLTWFICVVAALPMARRASSLEPAAALRYE